MPQASGAFSVKNRPLKVGVVGGSIAGCAAAIEFSRAGCDVAVFERSREKLRERGAGIGFPAPVMDSLKERDIVDKDFPSIISTTVALVTRDGEVDNGAGRVLWEIPFERTLISWQTLYDNLYRRMPEGIYHQDAAVAGIQQLDEETVAVRTAGGEETRFDFVICSDGYKSLGRTTLFPDQELRYAGYIAWRGYLPEAQVRDPAPYEKRSTLAFHEHGHCVMYFVPGEHDRGRMMNWVWYEVVPEDDLPRMLTDRSGETHAHSLPHGKATQWHMDYLHDRAGLLPDYCADVIMATEQPFIQSLYDLQAPSYFEGRICLVGDASSVVRPHTAGGTPKALTQAVSLACALREHDSLDEALRAWNAQERAVVDEIIEIGETMGRGTVLNTPDFKTMDEAGAKEWWMTKVRPQGQ